MQFHEYGADQKETILLLHGGGLSWWNYREAAEKLQGEYRVILPILDGHAGSDRPFTTIEDNASIGFRDGEFDDLAGGREAFDGFLTCTDRDDVDCDKVDKVWGVSAENGEASVEEIIKS